jgi:hypothetical protein
LPDEGDVVDGFVADNVLAVNVGDVVHAVVGIDEVDVRIVVGEHEDVELRVVPEYRHVEVGEAVDAGQPFNGAVAFRIAEQAVPGRAVHAAAAFGYADAAVVGCVHAPLADADAGDLIGLRRGGRGGNDKEESEGEEVLHGGGWSPKDPKRRKPEFIFTKIAI